MSPQPTATVEEVAYRLPWRTLLLLAGAAFATVTTELLPASLLLQIGDDLDVTPAAAGRLVGAWALTIAVASVPLTRLTSRTPRRRLVPGVLLLLALATAGTALAPSYGWALTGRITAAVAHGLFWSLLVPLVAMLVPPARVGRAVSVVLAGPALAGIVGIPAGATVGAALGWRVCVAALAGLLAVAALGIASLPLPDATGPAVRRDGPDPALRAVLAVALAGGLVLTGHFLLYTYIAPLLRQFGGYDVTTTGLLLLVFGVAGVAGTAGAGALSDRYPRQALSWICAGLAAAAAALLLLAAHLAVAIVVVAGWGVLIGLLPPVFQTHLLRIAPPGREAVSGAIGITVLNLGIAGGATLGGEVLDRWQAQALPAVAAATIAVATGWLLVTGRRDSRADAATAGGVRP
ncbi:MFS transporter [Micromonospora siamensis]|uniref:Predicted arabinose efflux permease, MFS family n=1 Tax=Micromonospora siamensis TaxID=299152 RepID=A0A1C5HPA8_9ACTN|nr:MFS transporter [Micromonospora siamensis]SCG47815.1 Predicted arabinose efflux permease, MFS family [Micromonospora siamensis]